MMSHDSQGDDDGELLHTPQEEMESLALDEESSNGPYLSSSTSLQNFGAILEPPSYSEAIFTSFDSNSSNSHQSPQVEHSSNSDPHSHSDPNSFQIWVSDPQKAQEPNSLVPGGGTYYTFLFTTKTNLPQYGRPGSEFTVRRRFKDVVTLSDRLAESYRGFFVPVRPDKSVVESQVLQMGQFVEHRRVALERYLNNLANHPVIRNSEELRLFLVVKGKLPLPKTVDMASRMLDGAVRLPKQLLAEAAPVNVIQATRPAQGGRDLLWMFRQLKQSVSNDWGGVKPLVVEEDKELLLKKEWLVEFGRQLSNVSKQAELLVKAQQGMGETMGAMGMALVKLTKFETDEALLDTQRVRAANMKNVAIAAVSSSRYYQDLNERTIKHLDTLHHYLGIVLAANNAFSERSGALLSVQTLSSELVSLQSRIQKLEAASSKIFGGDRTRMRKIEELGETIRVTECTKSSAIMEYESIKENNKKELERFEKERKEDLMGMLRGFVHNQVGYAEKMENVWEKLSEETGAYIRDSNSNFRV